MAQLRDFVPRVQAFARMCPVPIIKDEVLRALIMFSGISGVWKHRSVNDLTAGIDTYVLSVPTGAAIGWIEGVYANGSPLMPQREAWPQASPQSGPPAIYSADHDKAVRVFPVPADSVAGGLSARPPGARRPALSRLWLSWLSGLIGGVGLLPERD